MKEKQGERGKVDDGQGGGQTRSAAMPARVNGMEPRSATEEWPWIGLPVLSDEIVPGHELIIGRDLPPSPLSLYCPGDHVCRDLAPRTNFQDRAQVGRLFGGLLAIQSVVICGSARIKSGNIMNAPETDPSFQV